MAAKKGGGFGAGPPLLNVNFYQALKRMSQATATYANNDTLMYSSAICAALGGHLNTQYKTSTGDNGCILVRDVFGKVLRPYLCCQKDGNSTYQFEVDFSKIIQVVGLDKTKC